MKILIVTQYFWPENFRINDVAISLQNKGHDVYILTGKPNYPHGNYYPGYGIIRKCRDDYYGIRIIRAPIYPRFSGSTFHLLINYLSFVITASVALLCIKDKNFDVIFVYEPSPITVAIPAILLKNLKKIPIVLWVQDLWPESITATGVVKSNFIIRVVGSLVRYIYGKCDLLLAQSKAFIPSIKKYAGRDKQIIYFPNYAEDIYKDPCLTDVILDIPLPDGFKVIFTGNIGSAQDFPTVLAAAEELKEETQVKWIIVGKGRKFDWLQNQITERGLTDTVFLMGQHPLKIMPYFYSHSNVMLVTLKKDDIFSFTIPGKIQSYMAAGRPIVGCLDGEGRRVVEDAHAGLIASSGDYHALARNILKLSKLDRNALEQYGKNAFNYYQENFDKNKLIEFLESTLTMVIKQ